MIFFLMLNKKNIWIPLLATVMVFIGTSCSQRQSKATHLHQKLLSQMHNLEVLNLDSISLSYHYFLGFGKRHKQLQSKNHTLTHWLGGKITRADFAQTQRGQLSKAIAVVGASPNTLITFNDGKKNCSKKSYQKSFTSFRY